MNLIDLGLLAFIGLALLLGQLGKSTSERESTAAEQGRPSTPALRVVSAVMIAIAIILVFVRGLSLLH